MYELVFSGILQGLVLAFIAFGVMIPFRILNFPDLTAEGAYPFGGAICASLLILDIHPILAILIASISVGIIGMGTAFIYLHFRINSLLSGIILSTMLYSVNLRLMGKPNIALFDQNTLFFTDNLIVRISLILGILAMLGIPLLMFLCTEMGLRLRAVGLNPEFASRQGVTTNRYIFLGLFLGNVFSGLAGSLIVQMQGYADIGMGVGIVIHALAALMIGEAIIGNATLIKQIIAPVIGALVYQQIQGVALFLGLAPSDLKLLTAIIILIVLGMNKKSVA